MARETERRASFGLISLEGAQDVLALGVTSQVRCSRLTKGGRQLHGEGRNRSRESDAGHYPENLRLSRRPRFDSSLDVRALGPGGAIPLDRLDRTVPRLDFKSDWQEGHDRLELAIEEPPDLVLPRDELSVRTFREANVNLAPQAPSGRASISLAVVPGSQKVDGRSTLRCPALRAARSGSARPRR